MNYSDIIARKSMVTLFDGIQKYEPTKALFDHQKALVKWSLLKGRSAIFANTGLGKTMMEIDFALTVAKERGRVLILAPLAVAEQIVREGSKFSVPLQYSREENPNLKITVTNYEMLDHFDTSKYAGVVLDESSILKNFDGKTRTKLIDAFKHTPYRLCGTATPAPNDYTELGNHSEFLGIKSRTEMLSEYFVHDAETTQEWRLKGHATVAFWEWVCSWGALVNSPEDLGFDGSKYILPPLKMQNVPLPIDHKSAHKKGFLFENAEQELKAQRKARKDTMVQRVALAKQIVESENTPCLVWCDFNEEGDLLEQEIKGSVQVKGADKPEIKRDSLVMFADEKIKTLITKTSIAGFGLNFQHCNRMVFLGADHSYEKVYQAIRRCWRFGQTRPVTVYTITSEAEQAIVENYQRKEKDALKFSQEMSTRIKAVLQKEVLGATAREWRAYEPKQNMVLPNFLKKG